MYSDISYDTVVASSVCLALTSVFGLLFYTSIFVAHFCSHTPQFPPAKVLFISFGFNDCISLLCWFIVAVRATVRTLTLSHPLIDTAAYILIAGRFCKDLHFLAMVFSRLAAWRFSQQQNVWLSSGKLAVLLVVMWVLPLGMATPAFLKPSVDYTPREFRFVIKNANARNFFASVDLILCTSLFVLTCATYTVIIVKFCWNKKFVTGSETDSDDDRTEVKKEVRMSIVIFILVTAYLASTAVYWRTVTTGDYGDDFMSSFFFTVYAWCFNSALAAASYMASEKTLQRLLTALFEKRYHRRVGFQRRREVERRTDFEEEWGRGGVYATSETPI